MKMYCIIIDDEKNALLLLEEYISKVSYLVLKGKFYNATDALSFLQEESVDLIFSDINMPFLNGIEMAASLPVDQRIIFTTAYNNYMQASFNFFVIDYLLKPISFSRFIQSVTKAKLTLNTRPEKQHTESSYIFIKDNKQTIKVLFNEIIFLEGNKEYVKIHLCNGKPLLIYRRMKDVLQSLPPEFVRIHNSYIVNMNEVNSIEENSIMIGPTKLPVSLNYKKDLRNFLHNKMM